MASCSSQPFLPLELILAIIESLAPTAPTPVALPPTHPTTKTLLSLTRTSSITYSTARRLLYSHCIWIDNSTPLRPLLDSLTIPLDTTLCRHPAGPVIGHLTSFYLCSPTVGVPGFAGNIFDLFALLARSLRHLVVDFPFREFAIGDYVPQADKLRDAFVQLTSLETFCSVRDELYLDLMVGFPPFPPNYWRWSVWPNLRVIVLYNKDVSAPGFWEDLGRLTRLETVVFTRADGLEEVDIKAEWRRGCGNANRELNVILVNVQSEHRVAMGSARWKIDDKVRVREINVPTSYYGDEDPIELCQEWVKRKVLMGEPPAEWA